MKPTGKLPEGLKEIMQSYNITQKEINFNGNVLLFEIGNERNMLQNFGKLISLIRNNGLEVLAADQRRLDAQEALFFKIRQLNHSNDKLLRQMNKGFD